MGCFSRPSLPNVQSSAWTVDPVVAMSPRAAFFAAHEPVAGDAAIGRVSAELICPYPPGVPVLAPGEVVTAEALAALRATRADGGRIAYAADQTLATVQVVAATGPPAPTAAGSPTPPTRPWPPCRWSPSPTLPGTEPGGGNATVCRIRPPECEILEGQTVR